MDLAPADILSAAPEPFAFASSFPDDDSNASSSIASLMQISEKMESLLPLEGPPVYAPHPPPHALYDAHAAALHTYRTCLTSYAITDHTAPYVAPPAPPRPPRSCPDALRLSPAALRVPKYGPPALSPCSVREMPPSPKKTRDRKRGAVGKPQRKPKTYSKPVASRFCHICSRTPRRGHGAAVCSRMAEGLCRKIVCEQCIRDQGWCYEEIIANPTAWRCPHCSGCCPPRSQCHIYNRINARRKRVTPATPGARARSPDASSAPPSSSPPTSPDRAALPRLEPVVLDPHVVWP